jgi:hypothetical protein
MGSTTLTHDLNGNMTYDGYWSYKWDAFGRLREQRYGTWLGATYYYDTDGRRVRRNAVAYGNPVDYVYDGWRLLTIRLTGSYPSMQYAYGNYLDEVVWASRNLNGDGACDDYPFSVLQNALFSVYAVAYNQALTYAYEYDPYGAHTLVQDGNDADGLINFNDNDTRTANGTGWIFTANYTGQFYDPESGMLCIKNKDKPPVAPVKGILPEPRARAGGY